MEKNFWHEKWNENEIGFHQDTAHPLLSKHFPGFLLQKSARIFVPLCGKSSDMICLQNMGYEVVGLELSEIAARAFFSENNLDCHVKDEGAFIRFQSRHIEILCGDFFSATKAVLGEISAVFDRAALIALPAELRKQYASKMRELLDPGVLSLLIALEYQQKSVNPPPFAVFNEEVSDLFAHWCNVDLVEKSDSEVKGKSCHEAVYRLTVL
jgi:thiopurine S-methyltransferase